MAQTTEKAFESYLEQMLAEGGWQVGAPTGWDKTRVLFPARLAVYGPGDVGTGKVKDEAVPLTEIIRALNERFGTAFTQEDRLFFDQINARVMGNEQVVQTARANPLDKFQLGVRKLIENLMIERMTENDKIVTRYMDDAEFQKAAFPILAREIFESIRGHESGRIDP
jgi:hypothetical protein